MRFIYKIHRIVLSIFRYLAKKNCICYMNYLIVHPDNHDKLTAVKAVLKALKVDFDEAKIFIHN